MAHGGIFFPVQVSGVTASSEKAGQPASRLINGIPSERFAANGDTVNIVFQFDGSRQVTGVAFINHNIPAAASIEVFFSSDGETWPQEGVSITPYAYDFYALLNETNQYMKIAIDASGGPDIEIGEIVPGEKWIFAENFKEGYSPGAKFNKISVVCCGHTFEVDVSEQNTFNLSFDMVPESEIGNFERLHRAGKKVFVLDFDSPACDLGCFPGTDFDPKWNFGGYEFSIYFVGYPCTV